MIYSPDFPDVYGTGRVCYWTIQVPGASQIHFSFALFDIKDSADMVEVLDGYTYHVLARFDSRNQPPLSFNVSLDSVILYFFSDQINQAQGFAVRYTGKNQLLDPLLSRRLVYTAYLCRHSKSMHLSSSCKSFVPSVRFQRPRPSAWASVLVYRNAFNSFRHR